jgi:hypothetical protein
MRKIGEGIVTVLGGLMSALSIPLFFLNMFGGIVAGIWLLVLHHWSDFGLGIAILVAGTWLLGLVTLPSFPVQAWGGALLLKGKAIPGLFLLLLGSLWTYFVVYLWCGAIFVGMAGDANGHPWPLALWGYANAVGPWSAMASKDRDSAATAIAVFAAQLGVVAMMIAFLFLGAPPTPAGLAGYLFPFIALGVLANFALQVGMAWAVKADRRAGRVAEAF